MQFKFFLCSPQDMDHGSMLNIDEDRWMCLCYISCAVWHKGKSRLCPQPRLSYPTHLPAVHTHAIHTSSRARHGALGTQILKLSEQLKFCGLSVTSPCLSCHSHTGPPFHCILQASALSTSFCFSFGYMRDLIFFGLLIKLSAY